MIFGVSDTPLIKAARIGAVTATYNPANMVPVTQLITLFCPLHAALCGQR